MSLYRVHPSGDVSGATDTAQLLMAFASGKHIEQSPGIYFVSGLALSGISGRRWYGYGATIRPVGACVAATFSSCGPLWIKGLRIDGTGTSTNGSGIGALFFDGCVSPSVSEVEFVSIFGRGAYYSDCVSPRHFDCRHSYFTQAQISFRGNCTDGYATGNVIDDGGLMTTSAHCIDVEAYDQDKAERCFVRGNSIKTVAAGIQFTANVSDCLIEGNDVIATPANNGIKLDGSKAGNVVRGNRITGGAYGIFDASTNGTLVELNTVSYPATYGIRISGGPSVCRHNVIRGGSRGIQSKNASANGMVLIGNLCEGAAQDGINVGDSASSAVANVIAHANVARNNGRYGMVGWGSSTASANVCTGNVSANFAGIFA